MACADCEMPMEYDRVWPIPQKPCPADVPVMWNIRPWHNQLLFQLTMLGSEGCTEGIDIRAEGQGVAGTRIQSWGSKVEAG